MKNSKGKELKCNMLIFKRKNMSFKLMGFADPKGPIIKLDTVMKTDICPSQMTKENTINTLSAQHIRLYSCLSSMLD